MKYYLIGKRGILVSSEPEKGASCLTIEVENAPEGSEIIFNVSDRIIYRVIENGRCELNKSIIKEGPITITLFKKDSPEEAIRLDSLYLIVSDSELVIIPNYLEHESIITNLRIQLDNIAETTQKLQKRISEIYDGVDIL